MERAPKIVIDTSIFINPSAYRFFGLDPQEALKNFLSLLKKKNILCYIPPNVYGELMQFIENNSSLDTSILIQKPPASYQSSIPALFFYEFIEEMRARTNKGLRIAEKYTCKALKEKKEEELIKGLRQEYRVGVREGIIDSKEDFDLILLAKELKAYLATVDLGLVKWAHKLGIPTLGAKELSDLLRSACHAKNKN